MISRICPRNHNYFIRFELDYYILFGSNTEGAIAAILIALFEYKIIKAAKINTQEEIDNLPSLYNCGSYSHSDLLKETMNVCSSKKKLIKIIDWLESLGFIVIDYPIGKPKQYYLNIEKLKEAIVNKEKYSFHDSTDTVNIPSTDKHPYPNGVGSTDKHPYPNGATPLPKWGDYPYPNGVGCGVDTLYTKKENKKDPPLQDCARAHVDPWTEEEEEDLFKNSSSPVGIEDPVPSTNTLEEEDAKRVSADQNQTSTESVQIDPLNALKDFVRGKVPKEHLEGFIAFYLTEIKSREIKCPIKYLEKAFDDLWIIYTSEITNNSFFVHKKKKTSQKPTKQTSPVRSNSQYSGACRTTPDNMCAEQDMKPQGETQIGLGIQAKIKERLQQERKNGNLDKVIDRYLI